MVAVINPSPSLNDAVNYNEHKVRDQVAEFIHAANYPKDTEKLGITDRLNMLKNLAALNQRTELNAIHISLNFDPSENLDKQKLSAIADSYMEKIGFGKQPYLVYEHRDAAHPHIHIVTTNIRTDGTGINTFMIGKNKSMPAAEQIEKDFGLVVARGRGNRNWEMPAIDIEKVLYGKRPTKQAIANVVNYVVKNYKFSSIPEFNAVLKHFNVLADRGEKDSGMYRHNGLVYRVLDNNGQKVGVPIKASSISTKPTIKGLSEKFEANKKGKEPFKAGIRGAIDWALLQNPGMPIDHLKESLRRNNIDMSVLKNNQGLLYGVTFIDHKNKAVFKGSDLGDEYSLKSIEKRCEMIPDETRGHIVNIHQGERYSVRVENERLKTIPGYIRNSPINSFFPKENIRQQIAAIRADPSMGIVSFIPEFLQVTQGNEQTPYELTAKKKKKKKRRY